MHNTIKCLAILPILLVSFIVNGQNDLKKADKQFELKAYELAIESYKLELLDNPKCQKCVFKIAEAYRLQNESLDAAVWYRKVTDTSILPADYTLNHGLMMKKMGQYEKARDLFYEYQVVDPVLGNHFAESCDAAISILSDLPDFDISLYKGSSDNTDYGVAFFKDKVIYSSFRKDVLRDLGKNTEQSLNPLGSQLFVTTPGLEAKLGSIEYLRSDAEETYDIVSISYSPSDKFCAFAKSNYAKSGMEILANDDDMHLYFGKTEENGDFYAELGFEHNMVGYSTGYPAFSADGKTLYFASNRPGGYGGFDIYASTYENKAWSAPVNLGESVNTQGNEITPFYHDSKLYFSSDFVMGVGGYDIFTSDMVNDTWSVAMNVGNGVNSPEDDFYPAIQPETGVMYFASNRIGGRGGYDIYVGWPIHRHDMISLSDIMEDEQIPAAVAIEDARPSETNNMESVAPVAVAVNASEEVVEKTIVETTPVAEVKSSDTPVLDAYGDTPPAAVNLEELERKTQMGTIAISDAVKVSYGEVVNTNSNVYFIQLAALYSSGGNVLPYKNLIDYGNIYKSQGSSVTKIKLGYFYDKYEADRILAQVKSKGFSDAFITTDVLNNGNMELLISKNDTAVDFGQEYNAGYTSGTQYKVRLAAYEDPIWFEVNKVKDLGVIEQWSKKDWTIFVLSGYGSFDDANSARIAALNRGFSDAEVVVDRDGILETVTNH